jgi:hypothetical protein
MAEPSKLLSNVLHLCYGEPVELNLKDARETALLAHKYEFVKVEERLQALMIRSWLRTNPLELYWFACRMDWDKQMHEAAKVAMCSPELTDEDAPIYEDMRHCSAIDFKKLVTYKAACMFRVKQRDPDMSDFLALDWEWAKTKLLASWHG